MKVKCITDNVLIHKPVEGDKRHGALILSDYLTKDTCWTKVYQVGPQSQLKPNDEVLISRRITTMDIEINGEQLNNTSDKSVLAYKRNNELKCTEGTFLYEIVNNIEEITDLGIIVIKKTTTKEFEPIWVKVYAAGPKSGLKAGDEALIAYKADAYDIKMNINGEEKTLHNGGSEEIIAYRTP